MLSCVLIILKPQFKTAGLYILLTMSVLLSVHAATASFDSFTP